MYFFCFQVQSLIQNCPQENAVGIFRLDSKAQYSVIALGLYFLEGGYQYSEYIIPYLIKVAKGLPKVLWVDDIRSNKHEKIPVSEKFSFSLNTLLSDIAVFCPDQSSIIIHTQVEILSTLTNLIKTSKESQVLSPITLCKAIVPTLLGLCRAMGRYSMDQCPLSSRLFPKKLSVPLLDTDVSSGFIKQHENQLPQFRPIVPQSMFESSHAIQTEPVSLSPGKEYMLPDLSNLFFRKYGSSFNQFQDSKFDHYYNDTPNRLNFPIHHLQAIFAVSKKLLTKETLEHLDGQACDIFNLQQIKPYGYKSFSETINLVMVTLLREILQNQFNLPLPFKKDVQEFVKHLFLSGQTELQNKANETYEIDQNELELGVVNKYKINVLANAICVDLLVWAIGDEAGKCLIYLFVFTTFI